MHLIAIIITAYVHFACSKANISSRIWGGLPANEDEYPYVVLVSPKDMSFTCTGSIITNSWVLTAAHCFNEMPLEMKPDIIITAAYGGAMSQTRGVEKIHSYPGLYAGAQPHDAALLRLKEPFQFNNYVQPVRLGTFTAAYLSRGEMCTAMGYGHSEHGGFKLRWVDVMTVDHKTCSRTHGFLPFFKKYICTLRDKSFTGACPGDSGGPLVCDGVQIGVLFGEIPPGGTFISGCYGRDAVGVYTSTNHVMHWIKRRVENLPSPVVMD